MHQFQLIMRPARVLLCLGGASGGLLLGGCTSPPAAPPQAALAVTQYKDLTPKLTEKDYEEVVKGISSELLRRGLPSGSVVMLGPVDTKGTPHQVDIDALQTEISAAIGTSGDVRFTIQQSVLANEPAVDEMYKLIDLNWFNQNPITSEDLQKFGKMAKVNEIIFGRVYSHDDPLPGGGRLLTYTFAWSLGNVETGALDLTPIPVKVSKELAP